MNKIIDFCLKNRLIIIMLTILLFFFGVKSIKETPVDAIPDLSDVQVIIKTSYSGQSPKIVEEQITNPLSKAMLSVPKTKIVRGFSFFGDSYIYIIFEDGTDIYWARSRVIEYLNQVKKDLPENVEPVLGPDASGVGWVYQYALVSKTKSLDELKSLQDWYLKQELQSVQGVSEIATVGGFEKNYQVVIDPKKAFEYNITLESILNIINSNNQEVGGSVIEMAEAEYMIKAEGFLKEISDFENIPLGIKNNDNIPLLLKDVATIREGAKSRRGVAELNGDGEVVGGIVIMRHSENALITINKIKEKIKELKKGLPNDVEFVVTYDRSDLIYSSIDNLKDKLIEEIIVVSIICFIFLMHVKSTLVAVIVVPLSILISFIVMNYLNINANIMSLGGISIAIGAVIDGSIVMIENTHKHIEKFIEEKGRNPEKKERWEIVSESSKEVGSGIFASLIIITISFLPVFSLEAQEGKLFSPLAFTKTFTMLSAAILSVTLIPILMGYFISGKIPKEESNFLNKILIKGYNKILMISLMNPKKILVIFLLMLSSTYYPISKLGTEFMPDLNEGDLLYMPSAFTGISIGKAKELLQQTDAIIKTVPEVETVFGKIGRAETATDPAPLTMIETTIQLKDKSKWRKDVKLKDIINELDSKVKYPGITNAWVQPIKTRIDMLSTGIKTPIGIKITGSDAKELEKIGDDIEKTLKKMNETKSVFSEKSGSGRYINLKPIKENLSKYNITLNEAQNIVKYAIGGAEVGASIQNDERYQIIVRYPESYRNDIENLKKLPVITKDGYYISLEQIMNIEIKQDPAMYKSENGKLINWVFITTDQDIKSYISKAKKLLEKEVSLKPKYNYNFAGQYEYIERVESKMKSIIPFTIALIFVILLILFKSIFQSMLILLSLPFSLVGGFWILYYLNFNFSIAVVVGIIALAGLAAEFGIVMQIYLNNAIKNSDIKTIEDLHHALIKGAVLRIRPKAMTVSTLFFGLIPIMLGTGSGNEVIQKIAAPMIGGMITAPLLSLILIPVIYKLMYSYNLKKERQ